jgi:hypothetical protein
MSEAISEGDVEDPSIWDSGIKIRCGKKKITKLIAFTLKC